MVAAELRGGNNPGLNEALAWIGSRVDDIYGADVGRLEDVWIDPGTGAPRWLLVSESHFGGRTTLIPFEDATAGAGHVWVPYESEIVRGAPEIEPGAPLTHQVEASLRAHYAGFSPGTAAQRSEPPDAGPAPSAAPAAATIRLRGIADQVPPPPPPPPPSHQQPAQAFGAGATSAPPQPQGQPGAPTWDQPPPRPAPPIAAAAPASGWAGSQRPQEPDRPQQPPSPDPMEALQGIAASGGGHYVEIELSGELSIRGELRSVRVIPR